MVYFPEEYWEYDISQFDKEPPAFCYAFASNYQAIKYVRLDKSNLTKQALVDSIKENLSKGIPSMFGFTVYESIEQASADGKIPFPCNTEKVLGGHAIMAVGYDNNLKIKNNGCGEVDVQVRFLYVIRGARAGGNKDMAICLTSMCYRSLR